MNPLIVYFCTLYLSNVMINVVTFSVVDKRCDLLFVGCHHNHHHYRRFGISQMPKKMMMAFEQFSKRLLLNI